jgi:ferredoxin
LRQTKFMENQAETGDDAVKMAVSQELCISCGLCVSTCPDVYFWNEEDKAESIPSDIPATQEECAKEAANGCPTEAIETH